MAGDTKERILDAALELFAQRGYLGTSMSDIAGRLDITKGALYKHYASKQEILGSIVERMDEMDEERAYEHGMPAAGAEGSARTYAVMPIEKIRAYSRAQFDHWTKDGFASNFRKVLTLEQYRDPELARLYRDRLAFGPVEYMAEVFQEVAASKEDSLQLALEFYGPLFLLYSVYDGAQDKESVSRLVDGHVDRFVQYLEARRVDAK